MNAKKNEFNLHRNFPSGLTTGRPWIGAGALLLAGAALALSGCKSENDASSGDAGCDGGVCPPSDLLGGEDLIPDDGINGPVPRVLGPPEPGQECADHRYTGETRPAVLEFVLDISTSMNDISTSMNGSVPGGGAAQTRWTITREAARSAFQSMDSGLAVGLMFYPFPPGYNGPNDSGTSCDGNSNLTVFVGENTVPPGVLSTQQLQRIGTSLDAVNFQGRVRSTPTHQAFLEAVQYVSAATHPGNKYVVLITDGAPTYGLVMQGGQRVCTGGGGPTTVLSQASVDLMVQDVAEAASNGVRTFVIGSPGSEPAREALSRMAQEGGTARPNGTATGENANCHLDLTREQDFSEALTSALGTAVAEASDPCTLVLPNAPDGQQLDLTRIYVGLNDGGSEEGLQQSDPARPGCTGDWQYSSDRSAIELCPETCARIESALNVQVQLAVACTEYNPEDIF